MPHVFSALRFSLIRSFAGFCVIYFVKNTTNQPKAPAVDLTAIITGGLIAAIAKKQPFTAESLANDLAGTYPPRYAKILNKRIGGNINKFRRLGLLESVGFTRSTRPNHSANAIQIWKAKEVQTESISKPKARTVSTRSKRGDND